MAEDLLMKNAFAFSKLNYNKMNQQKKTKVVDKLKNKNRKDNVGAYFSTRCYKRPPLRIRLNELYF